MRLCLEAWSLLVISAVLALGCNLLSPRPVPLGVPLELEAGRGPMNAEVAFGYHQLRRAVFVDARSPGDFARKHVARAGNLPVGRPEFEEQLAHVEKPTMLIVYCDNNLCGAEKKVARRLVELGYSNVYTLDGGLQAWQARGYPTEAGP